MSALILGPEEYNNIANAIEAAKRNPLPYEVAKEFYMAGQPTKLAMNDFTQSAKVVRDAYPPQKLVLGTHHIAFSYEEQPAGMVRHISISTSTSVSGPDEFAMRMIAEAFGFKSFTMDTTEPSKFHIWTEEFALGQWAINLIELDEEYEQRNSVPKTQKTA
jgi:hypothetical protein